MILSLKSFGEEANYREIAGLWLALVTVLGLLGLFFSSLAILFLNGMHARGEMPLLDYLIRMGMIAGYVLCPIVGWVLFAFRRYWAAMIVGVWPVFSVGAFLVLHPG